MTNDTKAPERVWAQDAEPDQCNYIGGGWWDDECGSVQHAGVVEYVRADLALAAQGALIERAADTCEQVAYSGKHPGLTDGQELACLRCRDEIRALSPDATAALEAVRREAVEPYECLLQERFDEIARLRAENERLRAAAIRDTPPQET